MIAIINYGLGNIRALETVFIKQDIAVKIASEPKDLIGADKLILPGVGSFDFAMERLNKSGMRSELDNLVLNKKVTILGICVGMQMMANFSDEGTSPGLGWVNGSVKRFDLKILSTNVNIPHMGWNDVYTSKKSGILTDLETDARFYFLHSYFFLCLDSNDEVAYTTHGIRFSSIIGSNNIYGVQFHPEKSHHWGAQLLRNFSRI